MHIKHVQCVAKVMRKYFPFISTRYDCNIIGTRLLRVCMGVGSNTGNCLSALHLFFCTPHRITPSSEQVRYEVIGMLLGGYRVSDISRLLKIHRSTIYRIQNKFETAGDVNTSRKSGRPRSVVTKKLETAIKTRVKRNPERSIGKMASELKTSYRSVRRAINEMNMKTVAVAKTFLLTEKKRKKKIECLQEDSEHIKKTCPRKVFID